MRDSIELFTAMGNIVVFGTNGFWDSKVLIGTRGK